MTQRLVRGSALCRWQTPKRLGFRRLSDMHAASVEVEAQPLDRSAVHDSASPGSTHPCLSCGACCAALRASFPFWEARERGIPENMLTSLPFPYVAMNGTLSSISTRCVALQGTVGKFGTICSIYSKRSSSCRLFLPSLEDGRTRNAFCDKSREKHQLPILQHENWHAFNTERAREETKTAALALVPDHHGDVSGAQQIQLQQPLLQHENWRVFNLETANEEANSEEASLVSEHHDAHTMGKQQSQNRMSLDAVGC